MDPPQCAVSRGPGAQRSCAHIIIVYTVLVVWCTVKLYLHLWSGSAVGLFASCQQDLKLVTIPDGTGRNFALVFFGDFTGAFY